MKRERESIQAAIEGWRRDEAMERVQRWRGDPHASSPAEVSTRHRWLLGNSARDALGEAVEGGTLEPGEEGAIRAHLARAAEERELADVRARLRAFRARLVTVAGELYPVGAVVAELWRAGGLGGRGEVGRAAEGLSALVAGPAREARARADEGAAAYAAEGALHPDLTPDRDELSKLATSLLDATESAGVEAVHWLIERRSMPRTWCGLMAALRAPDLDGLFPSKNRWRRIASSFGELGFERELGARLRVEGTHGAMDPRARLAAIAVPGDVRIGASPLELGASSELGAAEAFGRGLSLILASPGLPPALRRPVEGSVSRAFGALSWQVLIDPRFVERRGRVEPADREVHRRHLGAIALTMLRLRALAFLAGDDAEREAERVARSLGIEPPPAAIVTLALITPGGAEARLRGALGGLALWVALRERLDEDWFRNPRSEEILRAGTSRGGGVSVEAFLGEVDGEMREAIGRAGEIFGG